MIILPSIDVLEYCFSSAEIGKRKVVLDVIYNTKNIFCLTKNYIKLLELEIENKDAFMALITELSDEGRLQIENTSSKTNINDEFVEIANLSTNEILIPITIEDKNSTKKKVNLLLVLSQVVKNSKEWIAYELVTKGICNVSYLNFTSNKDVVAFFENVYSIPRRFNTVFIFDRDLTPINRLGLKNKSIQYYTAIRGGWKYAHELKSDLAYLKKKLGPRVKLYYTGNFKLLHERKMIIDSLIISLDNSMQNILIEEPTWEVTILFSPEKTKSWTSKCNKFVQLP